jgi:hypothetical protein
MIELATMSQALQAQRLTFDVLSLIFEYISFNDPVNGTLSISQVSQHWRLVALLSPFLWSNITLRLCTGISQKHFLMRAYFERSQSVPIALAVDATRRFKPWERTVLLLPHAHRFCSVRIKASVGFLANLLWSDLEMDMPMPRLEAFETVITNTSRVCINRKVSTIDKNIKIIPPVSDHNLVHWNLWNPSGLTALTLDTTGLWDKPDLDDIYHALAITCHTIQKFKYQGLVSCIDHAEVDTRTPLEFPVLRSLTVLCHDDMVPLLRLMIIPALDSLTLRDYVAYPTMPTTTVTELMDIDELTSLSIRMVCFRPSNSGRP